MVLQMDNSMLGDENFRGLLGEHVDRAVISKLSNATGHVMGSGSMTADVAQDYDTETAQLQVRESTAGDMDVSASTNP